MNILQGIIRSTLNDRNLYEVVVDSKGIYYLSFGEWKGEELIPGDVIQFIETRLECNRSYILAPVKLHNIYLQELKMAWDKGNAIRGYIYAKNDSGYEISYKGFRCFLPYNLSVLDLPIEAIDIHVGDFYDFHVIKISDRGVLLSRRKFLNEEKQRLSISEVAKLVVGQVFTGHIIGVVGYGVFIRYIFSEGLLHINDLINNPSPKSNIRECEDLLKTVFNVGLELEVCVKIIRDNRYDLTLHLHNEQNKQILKTIDNLFVKNL